MLGFRSVLTRALAARTWTPQVSAGVQGRWRGGEGNAPKLSSGGRGVFKMPWNPHMRPRAGAARPEIPAHASVQLPRSVRQPATARGQEPRASAAWSKGEFTGVYMGNTTVIHK